MRRLPGLIGLGLILALTTNVHAEGSGLYVGGLAGASIRPDTLLISPTLGSETVEFQPGFTFGGYLGYDFGNHFRLEGELAYRGNVIRTGSGGDPQAGTSSIMFNVFYDFYPFKEKFEMYVGGGLGVATAQLETTSLGRAMDEIDNVFAYQLEAGVDWNIAARATFTIGYRFFDTADPKFVLSSGPTIRMGLLNHEVILKMRYLFNL